MKKELKIVMNSVGGELSSQHTIVSVDGYAIGCIQDIKIHASVNNPAAEIEVTFPNLYRTNSTFAKEINDHIRSLSYFSNVKIIFENIGNNQKEKDHLEEVGTDGCIDHLEYK